MAQIHIQIANTMALFYLALGLWGLFLTVRRSGIDASYRAALFLAEGVAVVQVLVGVALLFFGTYRPSDVHYLYGGSAVVTLPLVHQFLATRFPPTLAYALGCLFMFG